MNACKNCEGLGWISNPDSLPKMVPCPKCHGTGKEKP